VVTGPLAHRRVEGFVATEFALGVAVLLVPVAMVVLTLPAWSQRQTTGRAIAREVARAVARDGWCNATLASGLAPLIAAHHSLPPSDMEVALGCVPSAPLVPGDDVEVSVTVQMPGVHLPALGDVAAWSWTARHRQPVDRYGSTP